MSVSFPRSAIGLSHNELCCYASKDTAE